MRNLPAAFSTALGNEHQTWALCARVLRLDGTVLGFTSYDQDLTIDGLTYHASSAMLVSDLQTSVGTPVDNVQIIGLLDSDLITHVDLQAERYDGAEVEFLVVNPLEDPVTTKSVALFGYGGEATFTEDQWELQIRSLMQRLSQNVGETLGPACLVRELFDQR